jgi:photosystem II stability/assembly factor-like uncharacterized protein
MITRQRSTLFPYLLALSVAGAANCGSCDGGSGGGGGGSYSSGGGSWLVGQAGTMLNVPHVQDGLDARLGAVGRYGLDVDEDLLGIACRGTREAWVVGSAGLILGTADAGASWRVLDPGGGPTLRGVALAAAGTVYVAGDEGAFRVSADGGQSWRAIGGTGGQTFTSVATRRQDGLVALLASREGLLHRYDATGDRLARVSIDGDAAAGVAGPALHSVVLSRDGQTALAVGDGGRLLVSRDGGLGFWSQRPTVPSAIRDVWLVGDRGDRFVAVGDGGLVLEGATGGPATVQTRLGDGVTLRAIHLSSNGHGAIVGDGGAAFFTSDAGKTWQRLDTGETRNLYGLDALEVGPHL